jgi:hypothetical protein
MSDNAEQHKPARPWDLFNQKIGRVSDELASKRIDICKACPRYRKRLGQCKECNCIMTAKTLLPNAFCPIGKWDRMENNQS